MNELENPLKYYNTIFTNCRTITVSVTILFTLSESVETKYSGPYKIRAKKELNVYLK